MPPRPSWKGYLRLSLVTVPVQAVNAEDRAEGEIHFHQLHAPCHSRIRYQKTCPIHGEVPNEEIVRGYEQSKGQYVIIDDAEITKLRGTRERAIEIDTFVAPGAIDPVYFGGQTYYLVPDGNVAQKPYAVLHRALAQEKRWGIGEAVLFGREQIVVIRPLATVLCLQTLHYESQVRGESVVADQIARTAVNKEEVRLASKLIEASTRDKFDLGSYRDDYADEMRELIEAKVAGRELVGEPQEEEAPVINLMDALRKSVARSRSKSAKRARPTPRTRPAKRRRSTRRTA